MTARDRFPIIGIGASAGGIEAMRGFFRGLPEAFGAAIVVVTHLSPQRESLLPEVLAKLTPLAVTITTDGQLLEPDRVYVMPPGVTLGLKDGRLVVTALGPGAREIKPVDLFLTALALDRGDRAVAVILSGGDGDGSIGVKIVKEHGGLALAQADGDDGPETSEMPLSALRTGHVDFAISAVEMGACIATYFSKTSGVPAAPVSDEVDRETLGEIYAILRSQVGHDFSGYKTNTFLRRLARRIRVSGAVGPKAYLERLRANPAEVTALFRDLLINVTRFFRDPAAFDALVAQVVPKLFEGRDATDTVRVWVPACSTGEEVYSLAILLREYMTTLPVPPRVQIFATDIDERALSVARAGHYPRAYVETIGPERLARHFDSNGDSVVIKKAVRDLCTFAPHSLVRDPPFSRLDLVSCRNLLIYLDLDTQEQVLPLLHYALRPSGYLFIGLAENVTRFEGLFETIDKRQRIFRALDSIPPVRLPSMVPPDLVKPPPIERGKRRNGASHAALRNAVEAEILSKFSPPHAVVTRTGEAVHFSARISEYLSLTPGQPTHELAALARKGLRLELRAVLRAAIEGNTTARRDGLEVELADGRVQTMALVAKPLSLAAGTEPLFLVVFDGAVPPVHPAQRLRLAETEQADAVARLEGELTSTRERLQAVIEEYETSLEELKSSNEELYSVNEEAQSANEELEASKEEVQAVNEELHAVNNELNIKIETLDQMIEDNAELFDHSEIASVVLNGELRIRAFTSAAAKLFGIQTSDGGRLLSNFSAPFPMAWLPDAARSVLSGGGAAHRTIDGTDGVRYRVRLVASGQERSQPSGVVVNIARLEDPSSSSG